MKAIRLEKPGHPLIFQDIPIPSPGVHDVLVQIKAAGICHSDVHYRAGVSPVHPLPLTLGHEIAGIIKAVGANVTSLKVGDRVCIHYLVTCGDCLHCSQGNEQFCQSCKMIGKHLDGGYAEYINVPARNAFHLPEEISFEIGAIMMCSSSTSFHALRKSRLQPGETVAIFGIGGLGMSAIQLAKAFGALEILAIDINNDKLRQTKKYGAIPINATDKDPVQEIKYLTGGKGVDVALDLVGLPKIVRQAVESLGYLGRAIAVGLSDQVTEIHTYRELICKEGELIGSSDHLAQELPTLIEFVRRGSLDLTNVLTDTISLDAGMINQVMDRIKDYKSGIRSVITP